MPALIEAVQWETHRYPASVRGPQGISYRSARVSPTEYVTVKREDGYWRWDLYTIREHDMFGRAKRLDGGSRPTMSTSKAAAIAAWEARA